MNGWLDDVIEGVVHGLGSLWGDNDSSSRRRSRRRLRDRLRWKGPR